VYRFRIYLKEIMDIEELCLDALVKENGECEILHSWGSIYDNLLKEALKNDLSIIYIDPETNERKVETIEETQAIKETLEATSRFIHKWYNLKSKVDKLK